MLRLHKSIYKTFSLDNTSGEIMRAPEGKQTCNQMQDHFSLDLRRASLYGCTWQSLFSITDIKEVI